MNNTELKIQIALGVFFDDLTATTEIIDSIDDLEILNNIILETQSRLDNCSDVLSMHKLFQLKGAATDRYLLIYTRPCPKNTDR